MLKKFRGRIDNIDCKILELLNQRAKIAKSVAEYKKSSNNRNIFRPDRESQIIKTLRSLNKGPLTADHVHNIYREIISSCLSLETNFVRIKLNRPRHIRPCTLPLLFYHSDLKLLRCNSSLNF